MAEQIGWTLNVQITGGPQKSVGGSSNVEAYDKLSVTVPAKAAGGGAAGTATVDVQPGDAGQVKFLLITASTYNAQFTYKVNDAAGTSNKLDDALLLSGDGAVSLLGSSPKTLIFSNDQETAVTVEILVGRKATH